MRGRDKFKKAKALITFISRIYTLFPKKVLIRILERNRRKRGIFGMAKRYALLAGIVERIGDNVSVHTDVYLLHPQKMVIGDNVSIHPLCYIDSVGGVVIGSNVSIAEGVSIISFDHVFSDCSIPINNQGIERKPITIQDDVWIGAKATILGNVVIGKGTVIAAGAVVTKSTDEYSIVAGIPARIIGSRTILMNSSST